MIRGHLRASHYIITLAPAAVPSKEISHCWSICIIQHSLPRQTACNEEWSHHKMAIVLLKWFFLQFHISSYILNSFTHTHTHTQILQESALMDWSIYSHAMLNYNPLQLHEALQQWLHAKCLNFLKQTQLAVNHGAHIDLEVSINAYAMTHLQYEDRWRCREHSFVHKTVFEGLKQKGYCTYG